MQNEVSKPRSRPKEAEAEAEGGQESIDSGELAMVLQDDQRMQGILELTHTDGIYNILTREHIMTRRGETTGGRRFRAKGPSSARGYCHSPV